MRIAQSNVNLVSSHKYYEENSLSVQSGVVTRESFLDSLKEQEKEQGKLETNQTVNGKNEKKVNTGCLRLENADNEEALVSENYNYLKPAKTAVVKNSEPAKSIVEQLAEIRTRLLEQILAMFDLLDEGYSKRGYRQALNNTQGMISGGMMVMSTTFQVTHVEEEETSFFGKGLALTEDGRSIDFNVELNLSRKFTTYAGMSVAKAVQFVDPLVINVGSDVTSISDQSFYFDLDNDGQEDKLAMLGKGSGFLAYDKNGDGIINNGSELFGTQSGNGFADLAKHDSDGNGWIDENDGIYNKLQVWIRNEDGTDTLLTLQEADVGAIFLGNVETEHSHQNSSFETAAMLRGTGVFLKESGGVGLVQQLDLAQM